MATDPVIPEQRDKVCHSEPRSGEESLILFKKEQGSRAALGMTEFPCSATVRLEPQRRYGYPFFKSWFSRRSWP